MDIYKKIKILRLWCPQPKAPVAPKHKHRAVPITVFLTATIVLASFTILNTNLIASQSLSQVPIVQISPQLNLDGGSEAPSIDWERTFEGDSAACIIQTGDGGYAIVGRGYGQQLQKNSYVPSNCLLIKTDTQGNMQWNKTYEKPIDVFSVVETSDGGYAIAGASGTLLKTDAEGNLQWSQTFRLEGNIVWQSNHFSSLALTRNGDYILGGTAIRPMDGYPPSGQDALLAKVDSSGRLLWNKTYGGVGSDSVLSVIESSDGGYVAAGSTSSFANSPSSTTSSTISQTYAWLLKTDKEGNLQWSRVSIDNPSSAREVIQCSDGGYMLAGTYVPPNMNQDVDALLVKTDATGHRIWSQTFGETGYRLVERASAIVQTNDGGYAFAGVSSEKALLAKVNSEGKLQWSQTFVHEPQNDRVDMWSANSLVQSKDGSLIMAGGGQRNMSSVGINGSIPRTADNYFYVIKTAPFLPTTPLPPPPVQAAENENPSLQLGTITITAQGTIEPPNTAIIRNGETYTFTRDLSGLLVINRDNIIIDGAGYGLWGNGTVGQEYISVSKTGITLGDRSQVTVKNLHIGHFLTAIYIDNGNHIVVEASIISHNGAGVYVTGKSINIQVSDNTFLDNSYEGIHFDRTYNALIYNNILMGNSYGQSGLTMVNGSYNQILGNRIENCRWAMWIRSLKNTTIAANSFAGNNLDLFFVYGASENNIYLNNFGAAKENITSLDGEEGWYNAWDNGTVGNYWSDYSAKYPNAKEVGQSGVGDTAYTLMTKSASSYKSSPENTDHYPLLSPPTESATSALTQRLVAEHTWATEWTLPSVNRSAQLTMWPLTAFQWWAITLLILLISGLVAVVAFLKLQKKRFKSLSSR